MLNFLNPCLSVCIRGCKIRSLIFCLLVLLALSTLSSAHAHVVVYPKEAAPGSYEMFTIRVPNEKDSATTKLRLDIPAKSVRISHVEAVPGWKYELEKNTSGENEGVTWTATGPGLPPEEFIEFKIIGKVDEEASELVWKAYQTYAKEGVIEWTGEKGSKTPASVTTLRARAASGGNSHGLINIALILGFGAFFLAFVTLLIVLRNASGSVKPTPSPSAPK